MNKHTRAIGTIAGLALSVSIFSGTVLADENELAISEQYFPNPCFRSLISEEVDTDGNGFLSDDEISAFEYLSINGDYSDFSGELTGIEYLYGLTHVQVYNVTGLTALDTGSLAGVYSVDSMNTPDLSSVNVNPAIHYITLENTSLSSFDVTGYPELTDLILTGNTISSIDISNNPRLITAYQYGYYDDDFSRSGYPAVAYCYNGDEVCMHLSPDTEIITGAEEPVDTESAEEVYISTWVERDGVRYYYDENGELTTGLRNIDGNVYLFNDNGAMMTGLVYYGGGLFYFGSDGVLQRALINFQGRWYILYR